MLQFFLLNRSDGENLEISRVAQLPANYQPSSNTPLWINLEDPDTAEVKYITELFNLPSDFLTDPLDPVECARASHTTSSSLIITIASYLPETPTGEAVGHEEQAYQTIPIGIILLGETVLTVSRVPGLVSSLLSKKVIVEDARVNVCLALNILQKTSNRFIKHLQRLDEVSNQIEEAMRKSTSNEDLHRILQLAKTLVYFLNALKGNDLVLDKLLNSQIFSWEKGEREQLADALRDCRQAEGMADVYAQITANMSEIYASMISNNMNQVVKFLTAITLILTAPMIIASLYGMNVPLPFQESTWGLPAIVGATLAVCLLLWRFLSKKNWL